MAAYMVVTLDCTDTSWVAEYRREVPALLARAGGRYLTAPQPPKMLEGDTPVPQTMAILEFPSIEAAEDFFNSAEYAPYADMRRAGASTTIYLVSAEKSA